MKSILQLLFLSFCLTIIDSSIYDSVKKNVISLFKVPNQNEDGYDSADFKQDPLELRSKINDDTKVANEWAKQYNFYEPKLDSNGFIKNEEIKKEKMKSEELKQIIPNAADEDDSMKVLKKSYQLDPVLNLVGNNPNPAQGYRRRIKPSSSSSGSSSSSRELKNFKDEFREYWLHKKFEAINKTQLPLKGDVVNMAAARPWGVRCGDPNQYDMPWGNCMLAMECEPEYRIYRGDIFCGRTNFICCALQLSTYDLVQGFDVSFDSKSLSTDSDEKKGFSKENKKKHQEREKKRRRRRRETRKKRIKKRIRRIVRQITKMLNKVYRNGTRQRKKRTKQLKKFVKDLKKQYKKDRQSVKDIHEHEMIQIDKKVMDRIKEISYLNKKFVENATFREVLVKGWMTKKAARMLVEAYPELDEVIEVQRRAGGGPPNRGDYLEYDIEYGLLYY